MIEESNRPRVITDVAANTAQIWQDYHGLLWSFVVRRIRNRHDAEDVLQEVFWKIHKNIASLEQQDKTRSWVYRIARNTITDHYRREADAPYYLSTLLDGASEPASRDDPFEKSDLRDIIDEINPVFEALPDKYKQAIILTEIEGLTQRQMSQRLGMSFSGAKSRVHRAREKLKAGLKERRRARSPRLRPAFGV